MKKHIILALAFISSVAVQAETLKINRDQCRMMAIDASEDVAIARNTAEQARLDKKAAVTAYLPRLAGTASGIYRTPDSDVSGMTLSLKGVYMAGLTVTQPVYAGGKIVAANRLAEIGKKAAAEQQRMTRMDVIANADNAYWNYIAVLAKVDMTRAYLSQIDTVYAQTKTSYEVGMITQTDLVRIDARRSQIIYQLNQAESGADLCRLALCNILGVSSDTQIEPIDKDIPVTQPGNLSADIANRPELSLLKADVMAKEQQVKITRADFLPTLGVQAGWSAYGNIKMKGYAEGPDGSYHPFSSNTKGNGWLVMASLSVPIFHWGEGIHKVKRAKLEVSNANLTLEKNRRLMNIEAQQTVNNVLNGYKLIESANIAMRQAQLSLDDMKVRYKAGLASLTDMLDAQAQWQTSWSNMIESRTQYQIYTTDYLRATGLLE
ncbi:MAG: TolC family protein [Muribaculaceae bacterium]|nr:TolC family protein [Muribaculaceae bacterium]